MCRFLVWVKGNLPSSSPFPRGGEEEIGFRVWVKGGKVGKGVEDEENSGRGKRDLQWFEAEEEGGGMKGGELLWGQAIQKWL